MKKITIFVLLCGAFLFANSQTKMTFEDQSLNGSAAVYNGSVSVVANPVTTGLNASSYCLDVIDNDYAPVKFTNFNIPAGAKATYPYAKIKFKIAYKAFNGGNDLDYPSVDVFSSPTNPTLSNAEKLGSINSAWTTHAADSLVWKSAEFVFSSSSLTDIPAGILVLKVAKPKCEYLLDDIELIPSSTNNPDVVSLLDFESNAVNDTYPTANIYGGNPASTAVVVADPVSGHSANALQMTATDYNQVIAFNITLPSGSLLNQYDRLYFDRYSTSTDYAQAYIYANTVKIYQDASGYPSQGAANTWLTKDYELPSGVPAQNSFTLKIGYTSKNSGSYLIDNVKLHRLVFTGVEKNQINALLVNYYNNSIHFNKVVERVHVFDLSGHLIVDRENVDEVNARNLPNGLYIVKAIANGETFVTKVIK
jgi:hypothetical protein